MNKRYTNLAMLLFIIAVCSAILLPFNRGIAMDEGIYLHAAERTLAGEVPYRDFFDFVFPGQIFLLSMLLGLGGTKIVVVRFFIYILGILWGYLIFLISAKVSKKISLQLLPLLLYLVFMVPGEQWSSHHIFSVFCGTLAALCLCWYVESGGRPGKLISCGLAVGAAIWFTQSRGFFLLGAANLFLGLHYFIQTKQSGSRPIPLIRSLFILNLSVAGAMLPLLIYFGLNSAVGDMIYCTFIWVFTRYKKVNTVPYFYDAQDVFIKNFKALAQGNYLGGIYSIIKALLVGYLGPAALLSATAIFIGRLRRAKYTLQDSLILILILFGLGSYGTVFAYPCRFNIIVSSCIAYLTVPFIVEETYRWRWPSWNLSLGKMASLSLYLVLSFSLGKMVYVALLPHFDPNVSIKRYTHGAYLSYNSPSSFNSSAAPQKASPQKKKLAEKNNILTFIEENTQPDEPIFVYYYSPNIYFLSGHKNPTYLNSYAFYNTPEQLARVIDDLERQKVRLVIRDSFVEQQVLGSKYHYRGVSREVALYNPIENYVRKNYTEVSRIGSYRIFMRKTVDSH